MGDSQAYIEYLKGLGESGRAEEERGLSPWGLLRRMLFVLISSVVMAGLLLARWGMEKLWESVALASGPILLALLLPLTARHARRTWPGRRNELIAHVRERLFTNSEFEDFCAEARDVSRSDVEPAIRRVEGFMYYFVRRNWLGKYGYGRGDVQIGNKVLFCAVLKQLLAEELLRRETE